MRLYHLNIAIVLWPEIAMITLMLIPALRILLMAVQLPLRDIKDIIMALEKVNEKMRVRFSGNFAGEEAQSP